MIGRFDRRRGTPDGETLRMVSAGLHVAVAIACLAWAALAAVAGRGRVPMALALAAVATGLWAGTVSLVPADPLNGLPGLAEASRSLVWLGVLLILYRHYTGAIAVRAIARFAVAGLGLALAMGAAAWLVPPPFTAPSLTSPGLIGRLVLALLVLLVAENLYRNVSEAARWHVNLPCIALGGLAAIDLIVAVDAVLRREFLPALLEARAVIAAAALPLLVVAAARDRRVRRALPVSRTVVFHAATLTVGGVFLLSVGLVGEVARHIGASWGEVVRVSLLGCGAIGLVVALASQTVRSHIRRRIVDHFFTARYDYRREWQRVLATLSAAETTEEPLPRAVRAVADTVDSPAGVLLLADDGSDPFLRWQVSWNLPDRPSLRLARESEFARALRGGEWILDCGDHGCPDLPAEAPRPIWLAVPLRHPRDGMIGLVLLAPPRAPFPLDGETFDLLRAIGSEVAVFLAERRAAERLAENRRLADYAKRFAFVAHDVKTVASQLRLLLANAEDNLEDPEFRRDMLLTVRHAADRIDNLIARLRGPSGQATGRDGRRIDPAHRLAALTRRHGARVRLSAEPGLAVAITAEAFDAAVTHLLDNALEASPDDAPVEVTLVRGDGAAVIDITDRGPGMSAEFIRDVLFRPLGTAGKASGSGIGAWQARELVREAGGELEVLSAPGHGTIMRLTLPLAGQAGGALPLAAEEKAA